jgi:hypothetical protein
MDELRDERERTQRLRAETCSLRGAHTAACGSLTKLSTSSPSQWKRRAVRSVSRMPCWTTAQLPEEVRKNEWW